MLSRLKKTFRIKAAIGLVAVYAFCVLAPAAALAFVDGPTAVHCLTDLHGITDPLDHSAPGNVHADGTFHRHDGHANHEHSHGGGKSHPGHCCGLFCMTALAGDATVALATPVHFSFAHPTLDDNAAGRGPDRINRPPIA